MSRSLLLLVLALSLPLILPGCEVGDDDDSAVDDDDDDVVGDDDDSALNFGIGPGQCWGNDGLNTDVSAGLVFPDCAGQGELPGCLFDPDTYPEEQEGTSGVFDLADLRDPSSENLDLKITELVPVEGAPAWLVRITFGAGAWYSAPFELSATVVVPGPGLANAADMAAGKAVFWGTNFANSLGDIQTIVQSFGVPVVVPNGMLGVSEFEYERLVSIDPALFHVLRATPGLTDEERDRCVRGEPGDGCISGGNASGDDLRHCATMLSAYTGNLHWSLRLLIASNDLRILTAAEAAIAELVTFDGLAPSSAWDELSTGAEERMDVHDQLLSLGLDESTPQFRKVTMSACSKFGSALKAAALVDDRIIGIQPNCVSNDGVAYFDNMLDVWPDGELDVDYLTGDPTTNRKFSETADGQEMLQSFSYVMNAERFDDGAIRVLAGNGSNDQYAPVNTLDGWMPELQEEHPGVDISAVFVPNRRHGGRSQGAFNLLIDASFNNRRMPRASMCVNASRGIEVEVDWGDYGDAAGEASAMLWYSERLDGLNGCTTNAESSPTSGKLGPLDLRCAQYAALSGSGTDGAHYSFTDPLAAPGESGTAYRAFFPVIEAPLLGKGSAMSFSAPPQILHAIEGKPFNAGQPSGYRTCD